MDDDRQAQVDAVLAAAVEAAEAGLYEKADHILRAAVHEDKLRPSEIVLGALAAAATPIADGAWPTDTPHIEVTYIGPEHGVHLAPSAGGTWMPKGEPVNLPEDLARSLCEQQHFTRHRPKKPKTER